MAVGGGANIHLIKSLKLLKFLFFKSENLVVRNLRGEKKFQKQIFDIIYYQGWILQLVLLLYRGQEENMDSPSKTLRSGKLILFNIYLFYFACFIL